MTTTLSNEDQPSPRLINYINILSKEKQLQFEFDEKYFKIPTFDDKRSFYTSFQEEINSETFTVEKAIYAYLSSY